MLPRIGLGQTCGHQHHLGFAREPSDIPTLSDPKVDHMYEKEDEYYKKKWSVLIAGETAVRWETENKGGGDFRD